MIQFICDDCGARKAAEDVWILGFAAQNIGTHASRREVVIEGRWEDMRAAQPFAVHFCSEECKDEYMERVFAGAPPLIETERTSVRNSAPRRVVPVETEVTTRRTKLAQPTRKTVRRRA